VNLSIDYDDTYTRDPEFWDTFIKDASLRGHTVYCVTMRYPSEAEEVFSSIGKLCTVVCTGRKAKRMFMYFQKIQIDVWIDDRPDFCIMDAYPVHALGQQH
jgi:hypothetical protein